MLYEDKKDEIFGLVKGFEIFKNKPSLSEAMLKRQKEFMDAMKNLNPFEIIRVDQLPETGEHDKLYVIQAEVPAIIDGKDETILKTRVYAWLEHEGFVLVVDINSESEGH